MSAFLAVLARETRERARLLLVAALLGCLPLFAPLLPGASRMPPAQVRGSVALVLALALAIATPLVVGSGVLVRDLVERRLSFYLSRPIGAPALWAGKLTAAWLLTFGAVAAALLPALLIGGGLRSELGLWRILTIALGASLLLVLLAHVVASWIRLRSPWVVIDALLTPPLVLTILAARRAVSLRQFPFAYGPGLLDGALVAGLVSTLLVASYVQLAVGRTDARRSHGALSLTFWALALPLAALYVLALTGGAPSGLKQISAVDLPKAGDWAWVTGPMRGSHRAFLLNTTTGRHLRVTSPRWSVAFSRDGRTAAWLEPDLARLDLAFRLVTARLDGDAARTVHDDLAISPNWDLALSPSGTRLAALGVSLTVYDLASGRTLVSARVPGASDLVMAFASEDVVRLRPRRLTGRGSRAYPVELLELNVADRRLETTARLELGGQNAHLHPTADGRHLFSVEPEAGQRLSLRDGRTGALLTVLSTGLRGPQARFLSDGTLAVLGFREGTAVLQLHGPGGALRSSHEIGPARWGALLGEPGIGRELLVALDVSDKERRRTWRIAVVELEPFRVARTLEGLEPLSWLDFWQALPPPVAGSPATRLFLDEKRALVSVDVHTGARRTVLAP